MQKAWVLQIKSSYMKIRLKFLKALVIHSRFEIVEISFRLFYTLLPVKGYLFARTILIISLG